MRDPAEPRRTNRGLNAMRSILIGALVAATLAFGGATQAQDLFTDWIAQMKPLLSAKDSVIQKTITYRDEVCPPQAAEKRAECAKTFNNIIERRKEERLLLSAMIDTAVLPKGEGLALDKVVNPYYQALDRATTKMADEAVSAFPRREASIKN